MQQKPGTYFLLLLFLFAISCNEPGLLSQSGKKAFIKDIPIYKNGKPGIFYDLAKGFSEKLNISNIEKGDDSLRVRIWYDFSLIGNKKMIDIVFTKAACIANLYEWIGYMTFDSKKEITVTDIKKLQLAPKTDCNNILDNIKRLKILELPTMDSIPDLRDSWADGHTVSFEIGTKEQYRFYSYHMAEKFADRFWQAANVDKFLDMIEAELNVPKNSW
ncbi:hypothetical protein BH11BAC3_BH11BAC3_04640 [soil metagenome]